MIPFSILTVFSLWYLATTWPGEFLFWLEVAAGTLVFVVLAFLGIAWLDYNEARVSAFFVRLGHRLRFLEVSLFLAIWIGSRIGRLVSWLVKRVIVPFARWFVTPYLRYVYPLGVVCLGVIIALCWHWPDEALKTLLIGLLSLACGVAGVGGFFLLAWLFDGDSFDLGGKIKARFPGDKEPAVVKEKGTSLVMLIVRFIVARKFKICPFINLPEDSVAPATNS
ncbi:MAG: hypothetical protein HZC02_00240 [Candidatus Levybacteria bacterium]|nr:hypothetical protein [Candidatus Levybacteria bacterium]